MVFSEKDRSTVINAKTMLEELVTEQKTQKDTPENRVAVHLFECAIQKCNLVLNKYAN